MKKKILILMATLLALAFSASLATAANNPKGQDTKSASAVVTPARGIQPAPGMTTPPQNHSAAPVGQYYPNRKYYQGWGCGYYPTNAGVPGGPYYRGSGRGYGCYW